MTVYDPLHKPRQTPERQIIQPWEMVILCISSYVILLKANSLF